MYKTNKLQDVAQKHLYFRCMLCYNGFLFQEVMDHMTFFRINPTLSSQWKAVPHSHFAVTRLATVKWHVKEKDKKKCLAELHLSFFTFFPFIFLFSIFYFVYGKGRWLKMLEVSDVTEWLPCVNINLSFVTMLCRPENYTICFTCQFNLDPSKDVTYLSKDIYDIRYPV
jgi:hypothetical protein